MPGKGTSLGELLAAELEPVEAGNRKNVKEFYKALASNDTESISRVVATDLEWWFHGPPRCQHMMRMLTGKSNRMEYSFKFKPRNITAFADRVIVEGWRGSDHGQAYWAHVWTLEDGIMTQLREYFNTWLTVIVRVPNRDDGDGDGDDHDDHEVIVRLWQSEPKDRWGRSLPEVVLPI